MRLSLSRKFAFDRKKAAAFVRRAAAMAFVAGLLLWPGASQVCAQDMVLVGMGAEDLPEGETEYPLEDAPFAVVVRFDETMEKLTKEQTAGWRKKMGDKYLWDHDKVSAFFEGLKAKYDTVGDVKFVNHKGETLYFDTENCGWKLNVSVSVQRFEDSVDAGERMVDPAWNSGLIYCSENGVGTRYIEISIEEQKVYLFEDGELILETDCVTGNDGVSETEKGVWQVVFKASPSVLKDESPQGIEYEQPVNYWMAFNGSQGLHDAVWRTEFGGDIYKGNGSYGCVNLPLEAAEQLYYEVYPYFPVIVY